MRRAVAGIVSLLATGCFAPQFDECSLKCGAGCPSGWICGGDGYCHSTVGQGDCHDPDPALPDASPDAADDDPEPDGPIVVMEVDAGAPPADAGCSLVSLLANGDFDSTTGVGLGKTVPGWTLTGADPGAIVLHSSETFGQPFSPEYALWPARSNSDHFVACQEFTVPAGTAHLELTIMVHITTAEVTPTIKFDKLTVDLRTAGNIPRETLLLLSNLDAEGLWKVHEKTNTEDFEGEAIRLCIDGFNDAYDPTSFRVDDVSLSAEVCP